MILFLLATGALLVEPAAPAPPKAPPAGLTYAPAKLKDAKADQLVCKTAPVLGSRLPVRRCSTVADIQDRSLQDRQQIEHAQIVQEPSK